MVTLKELDTKSLILDTTTNLSRVGNFVLDENYERANYFVNEIEEYIKELDKREYDESLKVWVDKARSIILAVRNKNIESKYIADDSFTCGVILQNRALFYL
ncbi:hypothetical protein K8R14_04725 [bacterium]|nr:hypothetical protein [bacterium]